MELLGQKVIHKLFGEGTIVDIQYNGKSSSEIVYIKVEFASKTSQFSFPKAFHDSYLTAKEQAVQDGIMNLLPPSPPPPPPPPPPQYFNTFLVFQGSTYDEESYGEYIWAPISGKGGKTHHSWERLKKVHKGEISTNSASSVMAVPVIPASLGYKRK